MFFPRFLAEVYPPLARRRLLSCPVLVLCTGQDVSLWKCLLRHQETTCHRMSPIAGSTGVGRLLLPGPQETESSCGPSKVNLKQPSRRFTIVECGSIFQGIFKFFKAVTAKKGPSCLEGVHTSTGFGRALSPRCMYFGRSRRGSLVK